MIGSAYQSSRQVNEMSEQCTSMFYDTQGGGYRDDHPDFRCDLDIGHSGQHLSFITGGESSENYDQMVHASIRWHIILQHKFPHSLICVPTDP